MSRMTKWSQHMHIQGEPGTGCLHPDDLSKLAFEREVGQDRIPGTLLLT